MSGLKNHKIGIFIPVRLSSKRFPAKAIANTEFGKAIEILIKNLSLKYIKKKDIVICSTKEKVDNKLDCVNRIWKIGGDNGWYYANWLWRFRGFLDKLIGGVGLRRGRTNKTKLISGDALDCWRVLYSNKEEGKLLSVSYTHLRAHET